MAVSKEINSCQQTGKWLYGIIVIFQTLLSQFAYLVHQNNIEQQSFKQIPCVYSVFMCFCMCLYACMYLSVLASACMCMCVCFIYICMFFTTGYSAAHGTQMDSQLQNQFGLGLVPLRMMCHQIYMP